MLHIENAVAVAEEGRALQKLEGNCGRKLRRYLDRVLDVRIDGGGRRMLHQNFAFMDQLTSKAFADRVEYAKHIHEENLECFNAEEVTAAGTVQEQSAGLVQNSYRIEIDVDNAPVYQLKGLISLVIELSQNMRAYVEDTERAVDQYVNREAYAQAAREEADRRANDRIAAYFGMNY